MISPTMAPIYTTRPPTPRRVATEQCRSEPRRLEIPNCARNTPNSRLMACDPMPRFSCASPRRILTLCRVLSRGAALRCSAPAPIACEGRNRSIFTNYGPPYAWCISRTSGRIGRQSRAAYALAPAKPSAPWRNGEPPTHRPYGAILVNLHWTDAESCNTRRRVEFVGAKLRLGDLPPRRRTSHGRDMSTTAAVRRHWLPTRKCAPIY